MWCFKHVLKKFHHIREIIARGEVTVYKVHTDDSLADSLTKPLPRPKHEHQIRSMGIRHEGRWL